MDNASKNAKDMINSLQMQYNRGRQAAITNELVDIITGGLLLISRRNNSYFVDSQVPVLCKRHLGRTVFDRCLWRRSCDEICTQSDRGCELARMGENGAFSDFLTNVRWA